ncbi:MAG: DUF2121 domain-containing protein [Methanobrevibacter sp.]|uniref:DUF2121 domain-containing protein n=1 Tax=Methanobrevibacter millerae TaxID=230361 RepID=A0A8T3V8D9_9EURY|nr:DUF2121 domain-containing protein [Methanobrevibacter millerae]MBE6504328.1 DUF2121 domain-containing protein [Methanobrevibacter millerae]MBR0371875.1 DUF2121 domain-containing protein [Methanobrevibacter sp.]
MSLIIAYVGKKGCVMASDKRRIAYFGNNRQALEDELYNGNITTDEELYEKSKEFDVPIKLTDDADKLRIVGNTVRGEVSTKGTHETKRKRIYGTTNGYQIVELIGSEVKSRQAGEKGIILFGNDFAKKQAEILIQRRWKASHSLRLMGDIFEEILADIAKKTPTIGKEFDVLIQQPKFDKSEAQKHLNITIDADIKVLTKYRQQLTEEMIQKTREIELANKIIDDGPIGNVESIDGKMIEVKLNSKTQAFNFNWKPLAGPNDNVMMFCDTEDIKIGDKVVIKDEVLCLKRNSSPLSCNIILCSL